jgi:hypothetical protein
MCMADRGGSQKSTLLGPQLLTPSSSPSRWHVLPSHAPIICSSPFVPRPSDHAPPSYNLDFELATHFCPSWADISTYAGVSTMYDNAFALCGWRIKPVRVRFQTGNPAHYSQD